MNDKGIKMNIKTLKSVDCNFSIFDTGRTYTGNFRKYALDNVKKVIESPETQEKIKLREALGWYGHGRRLLAKSMDLQEVMAVKMADGSSIVVSNVPSNVTTKLSIDDNGIVNHTQDILQTETGQIVNGLHESRCGGFSWSMGGIDGGRMGITKVKSYHGMDYVLHPGMSSNRGYILESVDGEALSRDAILESIVKTSGIDDKKAEELLNGWVAQAQIEAQNFKDQLLEAEIYESVLIEKINERDDVIKERSIAFKDLEGKHKQAVEAIAKAEKEKKDLIKFIAETAPVFLPEKAMEALLNNDFEKALPIFESAKQIDFKQVPIGVNSKSVEIKKASIESDPIGWDI